jgi:hypothetical protein
MPTANGEVAQSGITQESKSRVCDAVWCSAIKVLLGEPSPLVIFYFSKSLNGFDR